MKERMIVKIELEMLRNDVVVA